MLKKILSIVILILFVSPVIYCLVVPNPKFVFAPLDLTSVVVFAGFGKMVGVWTGVTGKVGAQIFQMVNGIQIVKTFAIPTNPKTEDQQANRSVFSDIVERFKVLAVGFVSPFWTPFAAVGKRGWGNFIGANKLAMGKVEFKIADAVMSRGTLEGITDLEATYDTGTGEMIIAWDGSVVTNGKATDPMHFVVYDDENDQIALYALNEDTREDESATVTLHEGLTAAELHVFASLSSIALPSDGAYLVSTSVRAEATAPALKVTGTELAPPKKKADKKAE